MISPVVVFVVLMLRKSLDVCTDHLQVLVHFAVHDLGLFYDCITARYVFYHVLHVLCIDLACQMLTFEVNALYILQSWVAFSLTSAFFFLALVAFDCISTTNMCTLDIRSCNSGKGPPLAKSCQYPLSVAQHLRLTRRRVSD